MLIFLIIIQPAKSIGMKGIPFRLDLAPILFIFILLLLKILKTWGRQIGIHFQIQRLMLFNNRIAFYSNSWLRNRFLRFLHVEGIYFVELVFNTHILCLCNRYLNNISIELYSYNLCSPLSSNRSPIPMLKLLFLHLMGSWKLKYGGDRLLLPPGIFCSCVWINIMTIPSSIGWFLGLWFREVIPLEPAMEGSLYTVSLSKTKFIRGWNLPGEGWWQWPTEAKIPMDLSFLSLLEIVNIWIENIPFLAEWLVILSSTLCQCRVLIRIKGIGPPRLPPSGELR